MGSHRFSNHIYKFTNNRFTNHSHVLRCCWDCLRCCRTWSSGRTLSALKVVDRAAAQGIRSSSQQASATMQHHAKPPKQQPKHLFCKTGEIRWSSISLWKGQKVLRVAQQYWKVSNIWRVWQPQVIQRPTAIWLELWRKHRQLSAPISHRQGAQVLAATTLGTAWPQIFYKRCVEPPVEKACDTTRRAKDLAKHRQQKHSERHIKAKGASSSLVEAELTFHELKQICDVWRMEGKLNGTKCRTLLLLCWLLSGFFVTFLWLSLKLTWAFTTNELATKTALPGQRKLRIGAFLRKSKEIQLAAVAGFITLFRQWLHRFLLFPPT